MAGVEWVAVRESRRNAPPGPPRLQGTKHDRAPECYPGAASYFIGKIYRETKKEQGGTGANQFATQSTQTGNSAKTAEVIAEQFNVRSAR